MSDRFRVFLEVVLLAFGVSLATVFILLRILGFL